MENIDIDLQEIDIANVDSVLTGPQGPQGEQGEPGRDGVSPTINIGTVTTLNAGSPATVTNVGSESNVILDFGIPRGSQGATGEAGTDGTDGTDGITPTVTIGSTTTVSYDSPASVTNSGSSTDLVLNFEIPQGVPGDDSYCLSVPTIVDELPDVGDPKTFYFVPISVTPTVVTSPTVYLTVSSGKIGRIDQLDIRGNIEQNTPPATPEALRGIITFTINGDDYTVDLGDIYLAKINAYEDKIYSDGNDFYLHREIGYIENYTNEDLDGADYISTSGTLTPGDEVYYDLHDPTDTLITDENLVNSLRMIKNIAYPVGNNSIITTANVVAELTVGYHEIDPNHQYKKYVYMIDTSNFEEI